MGFVFVGSMLPKELLVLFTTILLLRTFRFFGVALAGAGLAGIFTPMFTSPSSNNAIFIALIFFILGVLLANYLAEEQPFLFMVLITIGFVMICLNWQNIIASLNSGIPTFSMPSLGSLGSLSGLPGF